MLRDTFNIIKDILIVAASKGETDEEDVTNGANKTYIKGNAGLNYPQLKSYLNELMEIKFLKKENGMYITTQKGLEFLEKYYEFQMFLNEIINTPKINFEYPRLAQR